MLEIDRGTGRPYKGNYSSYLEQRQEVDRQRKKQDDERTRLIAQELEWVRANPKGRTTKSKARIQRYEELVQEHQKILRQDLRLQIPFSRRLGDKVLEVRGLGKSFDGRVLMHDLSFELPPGAILGVVGANGTGKTTLVRMILGQEEPDAGEIVVGPSVDLCYLDQSREELAPGKTVFEEITGGHDRIEVGGAELNARSYVARFNFRGSDQTKLVGTLSGGERNRVQMAKMLARGGNLVILDEPTNDLDLSTLRVLEDALLEFPGCAIVVTHDRWFLDRIATHILAFEGDGETWFHAGNYESYREERAARRRAQGLAAEEAKGPHRKLSG
jgi:ATPase subunit of ABC transporter with duplicated ATPase domains